MSDWAIEEVWDLIQTEKVRDYLQYLMDYDPERLDETATILNDIRALTWSFFHELSPERLATRAELEYVLDESKRGHEFIASVKSEPDDSDIFSDWDERDDCLVFNYINYLSEWNPARLDDWSRFVKDIQILTWDIFVVLRHRTAKSSEIKAILKASLSDIEKSGKILHAHSLRSYAAN